MAAYGIRHMTGLGESCFSGDKAGCCSNRKDALSSEVLPKIAKAGGNRTGATGGLILLYGWAKYPISTVY